MRNIWKSKFPSGMSTSDTNGASQVPRIPASLPYPAFLNAFLRPLKPCIVTGLADNWPASNAWTRRDPLTTELVPDYGALRAAFGKFTACITFCGEGDDANSDARQRDMSVAQFIDDMTTQSPQKRYLKDFHFMRVTQQSPPPYTVPNFFQGILLSLNHVDRR